MSLQAPKPQTRRKSWGLQVLLQEFRLGLRWLNLEACFVTRLGAGFQGGWEQFMVLCTNQTEFLWGFFSPWVLVLLASEIVTGHIQTSIAEVKKPSVQFLTADCSIVPHYREYSLLWDLKVHLSEVLSHKTLVSLPLKEIPSSGLCKLSGADKSVSHLRLFLLPHFIF